ncbi:MAG: hypothetical protein ACXWZM_01600 [Solirubrobacterales bacterium]
MSEAPETPISSRFGRYMLVGAMAVIACLLAPAPARADVPKAPALTGTIPPSPATSLTPAIKGRADGIITTRRPRPAARKVLRGGASSSLLISIYTNPNCSGTPVAAGTGDELEGSGITAVVLPDSTTIFYATATDGAFNTSPCSNPGLTYQQVTTGPGPPTVASVSPASPANNNTPQVSGNSSPGTTVRLFNGPTCTGTLLGSGSAAAFAAGGIQASIPNDTTTTIYASASLAGVNSICSATFVSYREDSTAPTVPHLTILPGARANENNPRVTGTAPGANAVRIHDNRNCGGAALASGTPADLTAGFPFTVADNSTTEFFAKANDAAGNTSGCSPAPATYVEDSLAPRTRITLGPGVKTRRRTAVFRFLDATGNPGTTFLCRLDRGKWRSCKTPRRFRRLHFGRHVVRVKATDAAGNRETAGAKRRFKVIRKRKSRHH